MATRFYCYRTLIDSTMSQSSERKTIAGLTIAFGLLALTSLLSMMGWGQLHGDKWLVSRQQGVKELQEVSKAYTSMLLTSQRFLTTGDRPQREQFDQSVTNLKQHIFVLQSLDGGMYARSEQIRGLLNEVQMVIDQLILDANLRNDKNSQDASRLLLTSREMREVQRIGSRIQEVEAAEFEVIKSFYTGDVKAKGNSLPLMAFILSTFAFVYAMVQYSAKPGDDGYGEEAESLTDLSGQTTGYVDQIAVDVAQDLESQPPEADIDAVMVHQAQPHVTPSNGNGAAGSIGKNGRSKNQGGDLADMKFARQTFGELPALEPLPETTAAASMGGNKELSTQDIVVLQRELFAALNQLERLASVDYLTEVLNVRGLEQVVKVEESRSTRSGGHLIAMLINCDNLKKVNEGLGHASGDIVLKETAKRIRDTIRPSDHVARVGGDEFLVLLPDTNLAYGMRVAERIRACIADSPMRDANDVIETTASIGVANLPQKIASVQEVVTLARTALRRSKAAGKNKVSLAKEPGHERSHDAAPIPRTIVDQLLDKTQFRTVFQPIIELATESTVGYEALSRGPDGAFESPADFFRICVENNILTSVDLQCLRLCLAATPNLGRNMRIHVNLFPSTLLETPVQNLLDLFPKERGDNIYCVEISEQEFISDPSYLREHVKALKDFGIKVAVDDVGFGRSSLETLILLEPDLVKVDRKYVAGLSSEPAKARLLRRLANVAKSLGAEIIAEGIEDRQDLPLLLEMGIDYGQGFLWGNLLPELPGHTQKQTI